MSHGLLLWLENINLGVNEQKVSPFRSPQLSSGQHSNLRLSRREALRPQISGSRPRQRVSGGPGEAGADTRFPLGCASPASDLRRRLIDLLKGPGPSGHGLRPRPAHLLPPALIGLACLMPMTEEDYSCHHANNFARSFHPMLRYTNGPPPI
ncbi:nesprin-1 isoform X1 [Lates japonicus]|uniref:Nesprin-1 isoform X1 n=1 Tax=Lates japonicus TaxID=270547 RepID=A0AAD3RM11_LATJO|nr:nesprin-1 isoform X1 [Lates japonicus]